MSTRQQVAAAQQLATEWLYGNLYLRVHERNNVIIGASQGLSFLGHQVHPFLPLSVDKAMSRKISQKISTNNASSYRAMHLPTKQAKQLPWLLLDKL